MPPRSQAHEFVYNYVREKSALAKKQGTPFTWEDSQNTLRDAWKIAKETGLSTKGNPQEVEQNMILNPAYSKSSGDMFRVREAEMAMERAGDKYSNALKSYGMEDPRTYAAYEALKRAEMRYGRIAYQNPKMPVGYYRDLPDSEPVIVRQYERKLPKRPVPSRETIYKRLKRTVAKIVGGEHDKEGEAAWKFEQTRGGRAYSITDVKRRAQRHNPQGLQLIAIASAAALGTLWLMGRNK